MPLKFRCIKIVHKFIPTDYTYLALPVGNFISSALQARTGQKFRLPAGPAGGFLAIKQKRHNFIYRTPQWAWLKALNAAFSIHQGILFHSSKFSSQHIPPPFSQQHQQNSFPVSTYPPSPPLRNAPFADYPWNIAMFLIIKLLI